MVMALVASLPPMYCSTPAVPAMTIRPMMMAESHFQFKPLPKKLPTAIPMIPNPVTA